MALRRRKRDRLRELDEASAYARCHGDRDESVRIVYLPPRRKRYGELLAAGEELRIRFEQRLDLREPDEGGGVPSEADAEGRAGALGELLEPVDKAPESEGEVTVSEAAL
jgi:hypothetical protein